LAKSLTVAVLAALSVGACGGHSSEATDCPVEQRAHSLSGFCVPRWVSLKHGEVMGRKGPGKVKVGQVSGWLTTEALWGLAPERQCR